MKRTGFKQRKRKCPHCKEWYMPFNSMQKSCANPACALRQGKIDREKRNRKEATEYRRENKTLRQRLSSVQTWCNKYVRLRDQGKPCISCGKSEQQIMNDQGWKTGGAFDAGHHFSRASRPDLRFMTVQIWRECKSCNGGGGKWGHKDKTKTQKYKDNLINIIGKDRFAELQHDPGAPKWDSEYLDRLEGIFKRKYKLYKRLFRS